MKARITLQQRAATILAQGELTMRGVYLHLKYEGDQPDFIASAFVTFDETPTIGVEGAANVMTVSPHMMGWMAGMRFELYAGDICVGKGEFER